MNQLWWIGVVGRLLLAVHFGSEAIDKVLHWSVWVGVIDDAGFPVPQFMLSLVVTLLIFGTPLLASNTLQTWAVAALLLFQIPTTLFFESTWYERADSISVMGGLLLALALRDKTEQELSSESRARESDPLVLQQSRPVNHALGEAATANESE